MEFRRILVPYDFSEAAGHAARYACDLGALFGAEITVMYVLPPLHYDFALSEPTQDHARDINEHRCSNARRALASLLPEVTGMDPLRYEVTEGDPAEVIVAAANANYDAIVMSTRGAGVFRRWLTIGSVASKVLHGSERPVITSVHFENHGSPMNIRRVLCAIDLGPQSPRVLCWGMRSAREFGATMEITHAASGLESLTGSDEGQAWRAMASKQLMGRIEELKRSLNLDAETVIEFGNPAPTIRELAGDRNADLVVLGRGVSQDLIGRLRANAYDIIRQCPCPVVSI